MATGGPSLQGGRRSATDIHNSREKKSGARESSECTVNSSSTATRPFCCVAERRNPLQQRRRHPTGGPSLRDGHSQLSREKTGARESSECTVNSLSTATRPFCCVAERRNPLLFPRSAAARGVHADGRADEAACRAGREHVRLLLAADLAPLAVALAPKEGESVVASFDAKG